MIYTIEQLKIKLNNLQKENENLPKWKDSLIDYQIWSNLLDQLEKRA
jgi:hypothetical protein